MHATQASVTVTFRNSHLHRHWRSRLLKVASEIQAHFVFMSEFGSEFLHRTAPPSRNGHNLSWIYSAPGRAPAEGPGNIIAWTIIALISQTEQGSLLWWAECGAL